MLYAFQDRENLFLVMDLMTGGDLRFHIGRQRRFSEEQTSKGIFLRFEIQPFGGGVHMGTSKQRKWLLADFFFERII